ncbi:pyruvate oxidase [Nonomuraea sp. NN258]|uniref:thiamine pyrophosphate-dependent enzyme n=1 Tax=Nonomuraea antri TaxID=2730852 RepID=UPI001568E1C1|nr:thiamine pyrophosphate-dependent enzyme [Nonomuraea antri]NRQ31732.1 pyruvate oxidase [Nonomuraea antri]
MARIASESLIERLADWGVDTIFGMPGDGINGIMEGLRRHQDKVRFVLVHHEEAAAFMATGYAKATGKIGVCLATSGPGGVHLLNGLYDAKLDHVPVLAITGMQETAVLGTGYQQEVHLDHLFQDVAEYNMMVTNPTQLPSLVDLAIRTSYARRGVSHLTLPNDIQVAEAGEEPYKTVGPVRAPQTAATYLRPAGIPRQEDIARAAEILNAAKRPAILVGQGALHARHEVLAVAEAMSAPVVKTLPGKAVVPDDSPYTTGGIGLLGTKPSEELMEDTDALLMVGTNFPYTKFLPSPGKAQVVQLEADPVRAGTRIPTDVPIVCDAKEGLKALLPLLTPRKPNHVARYHKLMTEWRAEMKALENGKRDPIAPQYLMSVVDELATDDAILTCDSGTIATWAARHWTIRGMREFYLSGTLATMAPGLPYAIAMQIAYPRRQVIAFVGDGGFAMLMAEFLTAVQHRLPIKVIINNNNSLGQILWEQMVLGYPEHGVRFNRPEADFSAWARSCGGFGAKIIKSKDLGSAVEQALAHDGPALVDVDVNPNEPPMPGKVSYDQAKSFAQAFLKGQPHKASIATTLAKDKIQKM